MTTRADLIETAALALYYEFAGSVEHSPEDFRDEARCVVDAVLPQITTAEQVEMLPELTKVIGKDGSAWEYNSWASPAWYSTNADEESTSELLENFGPLTVAWQPQD